MISKIQSFFQWDDSRCFTQLPPIFPKKGDPFQEQAKINGKRVSLESSIDLDLFTLHQVKELSLNLFDKTSLEPSQVKNINHKVLPYSFLGRTGKMEVSGVLKIDAIETVHLFMTSELKKRGNGSFIDSKERQQTQTLSEKWNQFYFRIKTNGTYIEFSKDAVARKKEYLEISNLLLLAIQSTEKLSSNVQKEVFQNLPLIICEDIDKCKTGLLSRIHHNILPFCMQKTTNPHLPIFPLSVLHGVKMHLVKRTLEEVCNGSIDVHFRNAFFQLMQKLEGLGLTQQELLRPEMLTDLLLQRGYTNGTRPYKPIYLKNRERFYCFKYLIQETIQSYSRLHSDEKELLGYELLALRDWKLEIFGQIYDLLAKLQKKALTQGGPIGQFLSQNAQSVLQSLYLTCPLARLPQKEEFIRICTKNLIKDLIINGENGELSEFGGLLLLQTIGLFEVEEDPLSLKYQLLEQAASTTHLHQLMEEQLRQKKILQEQVPQNLISLSIEHLRENPEKILSLNQDQILKMVQHVEELCLLCLRVIPFHALDHYSDWPLVFKFNRQAVLNRLVHQDPCKRIGLAEIQPKIIDLDFLIVLLSTASLLISPSDFWKIVPIELYQNLELIHVLTDFTPFLKAAPKSILENETIARHAYEKNPLSLKFFDLPPLKSAQLRVEKCVYEVLAVQGANFARRVVPKLERTIYIMKYSTILSLVFRLLYIGPLGPLNILEKGLYSITLSTIFIKKGMETIYLKG
ncbi:MAG: hypothetical protein FJZ60_00940 [Chlamydiae bacterium]|nr:hypothetical protein [Chlamydiota bacterium]